MLLCKSLIIVQSIRYLIRIRFTISYASRHTRINWVHQVTGRAFIGK